MINSSDIKTIWDNGASERAQIQRRQTYYEGKQYIPELTLIRRLDARYRTQATTNFVKYISDLHTGFNTTTDIQYTMLDEEAPKEALANYYQLYSDNNLNALDTEHFINSLLYGRSVEALSLDKGVFSFNRTNPLNWSFLPDENDNIIAAIYYVKRPKYSYFMGNLLNDDQEFYYVYEKERIKIYQYNKQSNKMEQFGKDIPNPLKRLPLNIFYTSKDQQSFFSDCFLSVCDLYDIIRSSMADDLKYNSDSFWLLKGVKLEQLLAKNQNGATILQKMKEMGFFPMPEGGSIEPLLRVTDHQKYEFDLRVSRYAIHLMGCVPDLQDSINANGGSNAISGIALKLLFQSMIQKSAEFISYFEIGLRDRVNAVNEIWATQGNPVLKGYDIKIQKNIPQVDTEWLQYLPNMKGIIPLRKIYDLLPFIDNPESVYKEAMEQGMEGQESENNSDPNKGNTEADTELKQ